MIVIVNTVPAKHSLFQDKSSSRSSGSARDRSPLQPVQESAVPRRRPAAAKKPGRGRAVRAAPVEDEDEEADDEPQPLVNGRGKGGRKGRAPRGKKRSSDETLEEQDVEQLEAGYINTVDKRPKVNGKVSRVKFENTRQFTQLNS